MKKIGFFQELLPNGAISRSSGRLFGGVILMVALFLALYYGYFQQTEVHNQGKLLQSTIQETTINPVRSDSVVKIISERPVLTSQEYRENIKALPGIPWEGVLGLIATALTYLGYRKRVETKSISPETIDETDQKSNQ